MQALLYALFAAALTSGLTWLAAYLFYRQRLSRQLDALREELAAEVEDRVRRGAVAAGEELLPRFRAEVSAGFRDAMTSVARGDVARSMAKTGAELVGESLESLFGQRKR